MLQKRIMGAVASVIGATALVSVAQAGGLKDDYVSTSYTTPKSTVTFSGSDWAQHSSYFYSGVIFSLNRDLSRDGVVLRGFAGVPMYEYKSDTFGVVDGDGIQADLMVGYMFHRDVFTFSGYIGVDYQDYDLTPNDPSSKVNGSKTGFKVSADLTSAYNSPFYFNLSGSYSTAFNTYWARGRMGYNAGRFVIGPEATVMGSDGFDAHRVGGFATLRFEVTPTLISEITGYAGYQFVDHDRASSNSTWGGEGAYGGVGLSFVF